jgi:ribosomal protein S18 acetylase RimI-like enzyme
MTEIIRVQTVTEIGAARDLFVEYAQSLGFSLCFQGFDHELANLPGDYAPPKGRLLLALVDGAPAGVIGLRALEGDICEMKRLYVKPDFRGHGLGRQLADRVIEEAKKIGYTRMRLDSVADQMQTAIAMYRKMGFSEIAPCRESPMPSVVYMELALQPNAQAQKRRA